MKMWHLAHRGVLAGLAIGLSACVGGGGLERGGALDTKPVKTYHARGDLAAFASCLRNQIVERGCNSVINDALAMPRDQGVVVMCDLTKHYRGAHAISEGEYPVYTLTVTRQAGDNIGIETWAANQVFLWQGHMDMMAASVAACGGTE